MVATWGREIRDCSARRFALRFCTRLSETTNSSGAREFCKATISGRRRQLVTVTGVELCAPHGGPSRSLQNSSILRFRECATALFSSLNKHEPRAKLGEFTSGKSY